MRNIVRYPVTPEEVISTLERVCKEEDDKQEIGGLDGMILHDILFAAKKDPKWFDNTFYMKTGYQGNDDA